MGRFASKLRIGEKIGFGFGLVGLLFLGVIWQYHNTLHRSLTDYRQLQDIFAAKKGYVLAIESSMLGALRAEKEFLMHRDETFVQEVARHVDRVLLEATALGKIDEGGQRAGGRIAELMETYHQRFLAIVNAWRKKGLDHNSGLQGAFRDAVHELEAMAGQLKAERLYLLLLQIRRGEKDLGLRRDAQYRDKVRGLVQQFKEKTTASELEDPVKVQLLQEIEIYRQTFEDYSREVLADEDIHGGKGPFRQAAHRIEALLKAHYVSDLESSILQLRRREKDYLLRGDKKYVDMALQELEHIDSQVDASVISAKEKMHFKTLLGNYRSDFLALIEQNDLIGRLMDDMQEAVAKIALLVKDDVDSANQTMAEMAAGINASSVENARLMLWIVALASFLGVFFAITITLRIVRPLRRMAGLLDQLAYEESTQRMPFVPGGRDEVNAMAESVNTMADHKAHFIAWWKTSMQEADACRKLEESLQGLGEDASMSSDALRDTQAEFREAITEKRKQLTEQHQEIHKFNDRVVERTQHLLDQSILGKTENDIRDIQHSAKSIRNILDMLSFQGDRKTQNS